MDVFVARQPIFSRNKRLFAYELLFRSGMSNGFPNIDGSLATSSLLSTSFFTVGIERIAGKRKSFINFTEKLLLNGTPSLFPHNKIVVEILETVQPTEEIIEACKRLRSKGYDLVLDDFVYAMQFRPLIELSKIIKVDFRSTPADEIQKMVKQLSTYSCKLLAEKIETYEEFQEALAMGFVYFQGYFFAKPEVLKNKEIPPSKLAILQLIADVNTAEFNVAALERLINQDVSISFKLLTYLNSAYFNRLQPISSIRQAIAFLGESGFKLFVTLIAAGKLADNKPDELIRASIIRARFLEHIGQELNMASSEFFMLGLFSLLDAMLDNSMEYLVSKLPLTDDVNDALVGRKGRLFPYLQLAETYESGNWPDFEKAQEQSGITGEKIIQFYIDALGWADSFS
jgi:c-di-GMP-related signal transduction protein